MGRKKKKNRQKIWCFYCDREFADEKVLTDHQKARHFKCPECFKRVLTMGGLLVHMTQVHHGTINKVPNAKEGRDDPKLDVYGMSGIPAEFADLHNDNPGPSKRQRTQGGNGAGAATSAPMGAMAAQMQQQGQLGGPPMGFPGMPQRPGMQHQAMGGYPGMMQQGMMPRGYPPHMGHGLMGHAPHMGMPPHMMPPHGMPPMHMGVPPGMPPGMPPAGMPPGVPPGMPPAVPATGLPPGWPPAGMPPGSGAGAASGAAAPTTATAPAAATAGAGAGAGAGTGAAAAAAPATPAEPPLSLGPNTELHHPPSQRLSLEEVRAALPKYRYDEKSAAAAAAALQSRIAQALQ